jgi:hypothetical protein
MYVHIKSLPGFLNRYIFLKAGFPLLLSSTIISFICQNQKHTPKHLLLKH